MTNANIRNSYFYDSANHSADESETLSEDKTNRNRKKKSANRNTGKTRTEEN